MAGRTILIEGLDLAGKTTLVKALEAELVRQGIPVRVSRNSLCPNNPIAALADQVRRDPGAGLLETGSLFLAAHLWDARQFEPPPDGMIHLQDSCWLRTLAYHYWKDTPVVPEQLARAARYFPRFDATIFLTAGIGERQRRLWQRERELPGSNDANDHLVSSDPSGYAALECFLGGLTDVFARAITIDSTSLAPRQLLTKVVGYFVADDTFSEVLRVLEAST